MSPIVLATESLEAGDGGIARVARLMRRTIHDVGYPGADIVLRGQPLDDPPALSRPLIELNRSRARYFASLLRRGPGRHVVYDFAGLARVHRVLRFLGSRSLVFLHGLEIWKEAVRPQYLAATQACDLLVFNSAHSRARGGELDPRIGRARVCWLATEQDDVTEPIHPPHDVPRVTMIGRLVGSERYKGFDELIACWPAVVAAVPKAQLRIVGKGTDFDRLKALANASAVSAHIELTGFVPEEAIPRIWSETTVFAMPSRGEGFGLVYIEAMRRGVPVLASVHDAGQEVNVDGQTGYNLNLDNGLEAIADRIVTLLSSPGLVREMGEAGRQRWFEHFRYSCFRTRFSEILEGFLAGERTP
ncbi:MAG TPA: glycosyltransferase family 4 protein [Tepidisphaeraceae bacterium]|nr:glycosyltransferase family 4 protein [Tepidisphaeraceae bacterium]